MILIHDLILFQISFIHSTQFINCFPAESNSHRILCKCHRNGVVLKGTLIVTMGGEKDTGCPLKTRQRERFDDIIRCIVMDTNAAT